MPKDKPKVHKVRAGRENRPAELQANKANALQLSAIHGSVDPDANKTDAELLHDMDERFEIVAKMTNSAIDGFARSVIISGDAGLGKTHTIDAVFKERDPDNRTHTSTSGYAKATGLYKLLYKNRSEGQVVKLDDCDSIFWDDVALSMLKAACDTTKERHISYLSEHKLIDEDTGEAIPSSFEFCGAVIFITNLDFDKIVEAGHNIAPHLGALISRSHYIDIGLRTRRSKLLRIEQVVKQGMLKGADAQGRTLTAEQQKSVVSFIRDNQTKLREISLRMAVKVADLIKSDPRDWERTARITCLRVQAH